jgi:tetratricopeptide (TPR) repeat protein
MIEEITISQLDPRLRKQVEGAKSALPGNPNYFFEICSNILNLNPGCLELRKKIREEQFKHANSGKGLSNLFGKVTMPPFMLKGKVAKNPEAALTSAETMIAKNPANAVAHELLAEAAVALEMFNTVVFAYECIKKLHPKDLKNLKNLGNAYLDAEDTDGAITIGNEIIKLNPGDGEAEEMMKRASVSVAMTKGNWENSTDFRTQLKDQEEAQSLEQSSKIVNDKKSLEDLIRSTYSRVQQEPENLNHYLQLSDLYHRYGDSQNAIAWIQQARSKESGKGDVSLEEKERTLTLEYYDNLIEQWEAACSGDPQNQAHQKGLQEAISGKKTYQKSQLESLVKRYPNDFGYRFELGVLLFDNNQYDECLQHFQLAQRNAKVRLDAILYLGKAYRLKGFYDLAIEQLNSLKNEIQIMDERKKNTIYELGCCYEGMQNPERAIEEFKLVYSSDISYRDVADKINAFYERKT